MALNIQQTIAYLQLSRIGKAKVFAIGNYANDRQFSIESNNDMLDLLNQCIASKVIKAVDKKGYTINDITSAVDYANRTIDQSESQGIHVISCFDELFPNMLKGAFGEDGKDCSPLLLHYKGNVERLQNSMGIAVIGTREPTKEGVIAGEYFSERLANQGFNIVSGLALGCDTSGHVGALKASNGFTTAFLAHGLDTIYPKENEALAKEILEKDGLLISEYEIGTPPMANYFVERDQLQSALSLGTIVVQTGVKGGTMHCVRATLANNKPLFAVKYKDATVCEQEHVLGNKMLIENGDAMPLSADTFDDAVKRVEEYAKEVEQKSIKQKDSQAIQGLLF